LQPAASNVHIRGLVEAQVDLTGKSDLERARALRNYVHRLVPLSWPGSQLEEHFGASIQYEPLSILMPLLTQQTHGFQCAGTAYVLARHYRLFDLDAYVYNAGEGSTRFSHCVTLVRANHGGADGLLLEDAHFNAELRQANDPVSIEHALDKLARGNGAALSWHGDESGTRLAVVSLAAESEASALWSANYAGQRIGERDRSILYQLEFSLSRYHLRHGFREMLLHNVGISDFPAILLLPLGTSGEREAEAVAALARRAHAIVTSSFLAPQTD
jgi:hypothetical protein